MPKLTYFLLVLVAGTIILSAVRHPKPIPTATASQKNRDDYKKINERFPTAEHVKYPNGQRVLYRITGLNMPQTGGRYLLFLTTKHNKEDISILTGYQLTPNGAIPLDELYQVAGLTGVTEADILQRVRNLIRDSAN